MDPLFDFKFEHGLRSLKQTDLDRDSVNFMYIYPLIAGLARFGPFPFCEHMVRMIQNVWLTRNPKGPLFYEQFFSEWSPTRMGNRFKYYDIKQTGKQDVNILSRLFGLKPTK